MDTVFLATQESPEAFCHMVQYCAGLMLVKWLLAGGYYVRSARDIHLVFLYFLYKY